MSGSNTLFSWTWKLKRKKPQAVDAKARGRSSFLGRIKVTIEAGRMAKRVMARDACWSSSEV